MNEVCSSTDLVSVCQFEPVVAKVDRNIELIEEFADNAKGCVVVFPELCLSGYDLDVVDEVSVSSNGDVMNELSIVAKETNRILVVGFPERGDDGALYNSVNVIDGDGVKGTYRKRFLTNMECDVFSRGTGEMILETPVGKMGIMICYDMSFPEGMITYGKAECDFVVVCSAWRHGWYDDWLLLARTRALENGCYVVACNQRGSQNGRFHSGGSVVASPHGNILANLKQESGVEAVEIDMRVLDEARVSNPVVSDRKELGRR